MNNDMRSYVINLLETYQERTRKIALLHYELEHPTRTSEAEIISAMALGHGAGGSSHTEGHISDKTFYIALNYQARANHVNSDTAEEVVGQLVTLEREQERLNYYVSLLGPRHAELLKLLYFEGYSQEECAKKLEIATRTVRRIKDDAIAELVEMYSFTGGCKQGAS